MKATDIFTEMHVEVCMYICMYVSIYYSWLLCAMQLLAVVNMHMYIETYILMNNKRVVYE